jgi:hypothetical protein
LPAGTAAKPTGSTANGRRGSKAGDGELDQLQDRDDQGVTDRAILTGDTPEDATMRRSLAWTAPLLTACAVLRGGGPRLDTEVAVRSHNASDVDVYLLCGDRDAEWLGVVPRQSALLSRSRRRGASAPAGSTSSSSSRARGGATGRARSAHSTRTAWPWSSRNMRVSRAWRREAGGADPRPASSAWPSVQRSAGGSLVVGESSPPPLTFGWLPAAYGLSPGGANSSGPNRASPA